MRALLDDAPGQAGDFVAGWMGIAASARRKAMACEPVEARQEACELETVRLSLANLLTFPWVAEAARDGRLRLRGAHFAVATGRLMVLEDAEGAFAPA